MPVNENKALIRQMYKFINSDDFEAYYSLLAPGYIEHMTSGDMSFDQLKEYETGMGSSFKIISVTINDMIAEKDKISVLVTWKMKHTGNFMGIPATGEILEMTNANVFKISGGKILEGWNVMDMRYLQQINELMKQGSK